MAFSLSFWNVDGYFRFTAEEPDWGYNTFGMLSDLTSVSNAQQRSIIEDDSVNLKVLVRVMEDPTGVLWRDLSFVK